MAHGCGPSDAAGLDIGNATHYVAVSPGRGLEPVQSVKCITDDLKKMAEWLVLCGIETVAWFPFLPV